eukprot:CAMPEP_0206432064 /NCGR_PEP_ID=MMETSP0324_2-20121206/7707_1 /ASSEMBLY_ACC=CAM_ASM_000836 /TAXON_ID=2866 /ORGANISM="Crypthecodinium cohnii, Strain Seligo" /LENGTH=80 /DNA_ID=CAMNT_0053898051 /DNA_START=225 /DNA_END=467 /DNA_ORIENTATION=-
MYLELESRKKKKKKKKSSPRKEEALSGNRSSQITLCSAPATTVLDWGSERDLEHAHAGLEIASAIRSTVAMVVPAHLDAQ